MEKGIHKKQNLAWNQAWQKRFGDGSVIEAEEIAFGQGRALVKEMLSAQVSFTVIPRGLVFLGGSAYRGAGVAYTWEVCDFC